MPIQKLRKCLGNNQENAFPVAEKRKGYGYVLLDSTPKNPQQQVYWAAKTFHPSLAVRTPPRSLHTAVTARRW